MEILVNNSKSFYQALSKDLTDSLTKTLNSAVQNFKKIELISSWTAKTLINVDVRTRNFYVQSKLKKVGVPERPDVS